MATAEFFFDFHFYFGGRPKTFIPNLFAFTKFFAGQKIYPRWNGGAHPPINTNVKNG
jgi:hypothetical protein